MQEVWCFKEPCLASYDSVVHASFSWFRYSDAEHCMTFTLRHCIAAVHDTQISTRERWLGKVPRKAWIEHPDATQDLCCLVLGAAHGMLRAIALRR
jgi:hypothetical protein